MIWDRLVDASWQGLIGFCVVGLLVLCIRRMTPNMRAWLWRLCALKLLISLVAIFGVPLLPDVELVEMSPNWLPPAMAKPAASTVSVASVQVPAGPDWPTVFIAIWAIGVGVLLLSRLVAEIRGKAKIFRNAQPWEGTPGIWVSDSVRSPLVTGIWRPCIVLPRAILSNPPELELALAHETAHIRRKDLAWQAVLTLTASVFWFHPISHLAAKFAREEAEMACDRLALEATGSSPAVYGRLIVGMAAYSPPAGAVAMAARSRRNLERRILAMNSRLRRLSRFSFFVAVAAVAPAIVPWQAVAQTSPSTQIQSEKLEQLAMRYLGVGGSVQELKYTPEQIQRLEDISTRHDKEVRDFGNKLAEMKRQNVSDKDRIAYDESIRMPMFHRHHQEMWDVLTSPQKERMKQLMLQYFGPLFLGNEEVAKLVGLPEKNRAAIAKLNADYRAFMQRQQSGHWTEFTNRLGNKKVVLRPYTEAEKKRMTAINKQMYTASGQNRADLQKEYWTIQQKGVRWTGPTSMRERSKKVQVWNQEYVDRMMEDRRAEFARQSKKALAQVPASSLAKWKALQGDPFTFKPYGKGAISYR